MISFSRFLLKKITQKLILRLIFSTNYVVIYEKYIKLSNYVIGKQKNFSQYFFKIF